MKGEDIIILDLRKLSQITDYFVLCSGGSERQLKAIGNKLQRDLKELGVHKFGAQGDSGSGWILVDYVDVVVHVFSRTAREFYDLEMLWGDAPRLEWAAL